MIALNVNTEINETDIPTLLGLYPGLLGMQSQQNSHVLGELISAIENTLVGFYGEDWNEVKSQMQSISSQALETASKHDFSDFKIGEQ